MESEDKELNIFKKVYFTLLFIFVVANIFKFVYTLQGDSIPDMIGQGVTLIIVANGFMLLVAIDSLKK